MDTPDQIPINNSTMEIETKCQLPLKKPTMEIETKKQLSLNKFALDIEIKKIIATSLINYAYDLQYVSFLKYLPVLRFTKFYKVCVNQYGVSSPEYKKTQALSKSQQSKQYFNFLHKKITLLGTQPYAFIFGKRIYTIDKSKLPDYQNSEQTKSFSLESLNHPNISEQEAEILVNRVICNEMRQSLLNVFKFYDKPNISQFKERYFKLIEKTNQYDCETNKQDWQQLLHHFLTINILSQIMKELREAFDNFKPYFEALAKPYQSHYVIDVAKILAVHTKHHPKIEKRRRANQFQMESKKPKQEYTMNRFSFNDRQRYDNYRINYINNRLEKAKKTCGNWEGREQQAYYTAIIDKNKQILEQ